MLVGANMPAVLVEMGFITNPEQETSAHLATRFKSQRRRRRSCESIVRFSDSRLSAGAGCACGVPERN